MKTVSSYEIAKMLLTVSQEMSLNKSYLVDIDSKIGDGDLGLTMEKGFVAASRFAQANSKLPPSELLIKSGFEIIKVAPSTMGNLMGSGLIQGGKAVNGKDTLSSSDLVLFMEGFLQGVLIRGKAQVGEKTIVDVLVPTVEKMKSYKGESPIEVLREGLKGAQEGIETEHEMMNQHGKAAVFREKTIGMKDPGSEAVLIMIKAFVEGLGS